VPCYQWNPTSDYIEQANVTRLPCTHGLAGIDELRVRSIAETAWYWDAVVTDPGLCRGIPPLRLMETN
jgi:acetyl-CoA synthetase